MTIHGICWRGFLGSSPLICYYFDMLVAAALWVSKLLRGHKWDLSPKWLESDSRNQLLQAVDEDDCEPLHSFQFRALQVNKKKKTWCGKCGSGATSHWLDMKIDSLNGARTKWCWPSGAQWTNKKDPENTISVYFLEWCTGCALATKSWTRLQFRFRKLNQHLIFPMSQPWMVRLRKKTASTCYSHDA
jgi:hypothetical protein